LGLAVVSLNLDISQDLDVRRPKEKIAALK
jgi:hypothetical protein